MKNNVDGCIVEQRDQKNTEEIHEAWCMYLLFIDGKGFCYWKSDKGILLLYLYNSVVWPLALDDT